MLYKKITYNSLGLFASNICLGKIVCKSNVCSSKPICRSNVYQSKPTNVNIFPGKPVLTDHVKSSILIISLLSILIFSVYCKFSIITINNFTDLLIKYQRFVFYQ